VLFQRLLLAAIVSLSAFAVMAPAVPTQASGGHAAAKNYLAPDVALLGSGATALPDNGVQRAPMAMAQPAKPAQTSILDTFPFSSNCFSFSSFCNTSFVGGCFNFCRPMITGCFNFFSFGCRTMSPSFFPFFNSFDRFPFFNTFNRFPFFNSFNFNTGTTVNCIQIMRMPGGGTITIRVC
jgi:hypothetical protein